jgi:hypothetical protein
VVALVVNPKGKSIVSNMKLSAAVRALLQGLCCAAVLGSAGLSVADVLPPQAMRAAERLRENADAFDRSDNFCTGKRPREACTMVGSPLAGGGEGVCRNLVNTSTGTIDLTCQRLEQVDVYRDLPSGGFVGSGAMCGPEHAAAAARGDRPWVCKPVVPMPADRFCRSKPVGAACTVEYRYGSQQGQQPGTCQVVTETQGIYFYGRTELSRDVVRCEAADKPVERTWTDATWWQKLKQ